MTLDLQEFIRRFLIHVLPKGLHRIRQQRQYRETGRDTDAARHERANGGAGQ